MSPWTPQQLDAIGTASEIRISTVRRDGTERRPVPIWVVRAGQDLYVRSYNGPNGSWYQQALRHPFARIAAPDTSVSVRLVPVPGAAPEVDEAYARKYGRGGYGGAMIRAEAAATTLRLEPGTAD
jgi:hypothetical protein